MGLLDLLKDPSAYNVGGGSKGLDYPENYGGLSQGPLLGKRVSFNITDEDAKPTFEYGYNHGNFGVGDSFIRGGLANPDRLFTDTKRIGKFLLSPNGLQFITKQVMLQSQNPKPQKLYNLGYQAIMSLDDGIKEMLNFLKYLSSEEDIRQVQTSYMFNYK